MTERRTWLARLLAVLLLAQWAVGPAQAMALASLQLAIDDSICLPPGQQAPTDHGALWVDQLAPASHALDHAALLPPPPDVALPAGWAVLPAPVFAAIEGPAAPRAPPLQPRAPPIPA